MNNAGEKSRDYSAKLVFKEKFSNKFVLIVQVGREASFLREEMLAPEEIILMGLSWVRYKGKQTAVYYRYIKDNSAYYIDSEGCIAPTSLNQKLEKIVQEIFLKHKDYKNNRFSFIDDIFSN